VGSPTYIKTPTFHRIERNGDEFVANNKKKKKAMKPNEVLNDEDWDTIRTFQATKLVQKEGWEAEMDIIRSSLNKMTEKNYKEQSVIIIDILHRLLTETAEMSNVGNAIFEIASNNRFYSKLYADLYSDLISNFDIMKTIFYKNFNEFLEIFNNIEHVNAEENYDAFCRINKNNERRKALSSFFVNVTLHKIITVEKIIELNVHLLTNVMQYIKEDNKKSEVDEMVENIAILYNKVWFEEVEWFMETIRHLAHSKPKSYPSLSNKSIFKCMDMIEM